MDALKYHGVFRGAATMPLAAFAVGSDAEEYVAHKKATVKECWMDCSFRCLACGGLVAVPVALLCDDCALSDGCVLQPFTDECEEARLEG